jgi:hypothetical protein
MAETPHENTLLPSPSILGGRNGRRPVRALAYLLGARALDAARETEPGIRWSKAEDPLGPIATTEATAAAWRRWRDRGDVEAAPRAAERAPSLVPKRA